MDHVLLVLIKGNFAKNLHQEKKLIKFYYTLKKKYF